MSKKMLMALAVAGVMSGCSSTCSKTQNAAKEMKSKNGCGPNGCSAGSVKDGVKKKCDKANKKACKSKKGSNGCGPNGCS